MSSPLASSAQLATPDEQPHEHPRSEPRNAPRNEPYRRLQAVDAHGVDHEQARDAIPAPAPLPAPAPPDAASPAARLRPVLDSSIIGRIAVFAFEVVEGTRQVGQLGKWITAKVADELAGLRSLNVERRSLFRDHRRVVPSVVRVRATAPALRVIEASVVLMTPSRARAVALRFEVFRGRWQATSITVL